MIHKTITFNSKNYAIIDYYDPKLSVIKYDDVCFFFYEIEDGRLDWALPTKHAQELFIEELSNLKQVLLKFKKYKLFL